MRTGRCTRAPGGGGHLLSREPLAVAVDLRGYPNVRWWREVPADGPPAPILLASPAMEPDLIRKLYESPPPGDGNSTCRCSRSTLSSALEWKYGATFPSNSGPASVEALSRSRLRRRSVGSLTSGRPRPLQHPKPLFDPLNVPGCGSDSTYCCRMFMRTTQVAGGECPAVSTCSAGSG